MNRARYKYKLNRISTEDMWLSALVVITVLVVLSAIVPVRRETSTVSRLEWTAGRHLNEDYTTLECDDEGCELVDNTRILASAYNTGTHREDIVFPPPFPVAPFSDQYNTRTTVFTVHYRNGRTNAVPETVWRTGYWIGQECRIYPNIWGGVVFDSCATSQGR